MRRVPVEERLLWHLRDSYPKALPAGEVARRAMTGMAKAREKLRCLEADGEIQRVAGGMWKAVPPESPPLVLSP